MPPPRPPSAAGADEALGYDRGVRPRVIEDDELLDRLLEAFADLGFDGASMRALCRHLGLSHNLIHHRYSSKEAAWYAAVDHGFMSLQPVVTAPVEAADPLEGIREVMYRFVEETVRRPSLTRIIYQEAARPGPRFDHMMTHYIEPFHATVRSAFLELQEAGLVRPGPTDAAFFFLNTWGIAGAAGSGYLPARTGSRGVDGEAAARHAVDIVIDGLRA